jgi:type II secretory pathway pseudopilin PulG
MRRQQVIKGLAKLNGNTAHCESKDCRTRNAKGRTDRAGEAGYLLAVVAVFTSVLLISLSAAVINWKKAIQREQEEELIFRGRQFMRAIELWNRKFPGTFPTTIDALLSTSNTRFLRKKWKDPMTNAFNWRIIKMGVDGSIQGLSQPLNASPLGPSSFDPKSQESSGSSSSRTQSQGGATGAGFGTGSQSGSQNFTTSSFSGTTTGPYGQNLQAGSSQSPFTPVLGGIVGVASTSDKESIKTYNGRSKYNEWEFVYVFSTPPIVNTVRQGQISPGQTGTGQGTRSLPGTGMPTPVPRNPGLGPMQRMQ